MDLQITGRVIELLDEQSGESRNGPWRKREFILETEGQYPRKVCVVQWGDDIDRFAVTEGDELTAYVDIQSREYNGRWYTDVKAWRIEKGEADAADASAAEPRRGARRGAAGEDAAAETDDDLPF